MSSAWSRWELRSPLAEVAARYYAEKFWTDASFGELVDAQLREHAAHEFRVWSDVRPYRGTLADVHVLARRFAGSLAARGVRAGDVLAFQLPNWVEAAVCYWGGALLGAVIVPIVHFYGPKELQFILGDVSPRVYVTAARFRSHDYLENLSALAAELADVEIVAVVGGLAPSGMRPFDGLMEGDPVDGAARVDPAMPAVIPYTSGTTANPKGVIMTHRGLEGECRQMTTPIPQLAGRPNLTAAPIGHGGGMLGALTYTLFRGGGTDIHLVDTWQPANILRVLEEGDLSFGGGAPYFFTTLLDAPEFRDHHLQHVRTAGFGTTMTPPAVIDRARGLGIMTSRMYGSTEQPSTTCASFDDDPSKRYTEGRAMPGVELRIVDDAGRPLPVDEPGEVLSRGPELFAGYTDRALTARALDAEGWYHTGDVGSLDAEGYLTISDRKADVIIRGGENVSAAEVEDALLRLDAIAEVAVVGAPDERLGEHGCAFLRLQAGTTPPDLEALRAHLAEIGLARQKWPEELRVVDDFPRTASGKIKKAELRAQLRAGG